MDATQANQFVQSMQQLQSQLTAQQGVIQQQQQQLAQLNNAVQHPVPESLKPTKPNTFTGQFKSNPNLWLAELDTYFNAARILDNSRTVFALAQLKGDALLWAQSTGDYINPRNVDFDVFRNAFLVRFNPITGATQARSQLSILRHVGYVGDYISSYQSIVQRIPDMGPADRRHNFINGLKPHLQLECVKANVATLEEAMILAQRIETVMNTQRVHMNNNNRNGNRYNNNNFNRSFVRAPGGQAISSSSSSGSDSMELGNINSGQMENSGDGSEEESNNVGQMNYVGNNNRRVPNVSKEEFEKCMKANLCLRCKKEGHFARNCPNARFNNNNNNNKNNYSKNGSSQRQH
jgi:Ty3 transposon capsid-like protein/Zinc knuckle